jgi:competence protein ComFB
MLLNRPGLRDLPVGLDTIHNYYERLVIEKLMTLYAADDVPADMIADIACVALNRLPPRYVRHDVDMAFYLSPHEYDEIEAKVQNAINAGITFVEKRGSRNAE